MMPHQGASVVLQTNWDRLTQNPAIISQRARGLHTNEEAVLQHTASSPVTNRTMRSTQSGQQTSDQSTT